MPSDPVLTIPPDQGGGTSDSSLAAAITRAASKQTYYTVRFLVDRDRVPDAYRAYAYFRWVDDWLDQVDLDKALRVDFLSRQQALVAACYRGDVLGHLTPEEGLLVDLLRGDHSQSTGLRAYVSNMMDVMAFDTERRGRLISQDELTGYTRNLATAVTEALHHFIGHRCKCPHCKARYLAATAAHITHMLRDTLEDTQAGYFNIPRELLELHGIDVGDVESDPYRMWVKNRVRLARLSFETGKSYLSRVKNLRCRLAGFAYIARFEGVLDAIQEDGYILRAGYPEAKSLGAGVRLFCSSFARALTSPGSGEWSSTLTAR